MVVEPAVPLEPVGERCEIRHEVNLLDIDLDIGDGLPVESVLTCLYGLGQPTTAGLPA